ncbi:MAG: glycosyltransferase family 4 protein, partial [Thermoplasmata archaeon]
LRAVAAIQKRFPSLKLMIVGDGSRREEVEATISDLNLSDSVTITGLVDNVFIPLSLCDIYVHISLQEGLPHSILEAMMSGKPVIASNTGGIPEAVVDGQNGILVEPEEEAIASAILSLLQDPADMVRFGKNGREFVSSRFSWKEAATRLLELYSSS